MNKILTLIIPAYNIELYIGRCLESMIACNYLNELEVLVIHDGGADGTLSLAREFERKYPQTLKVIDKINGGHGSTINLGIKIASGKFLKVVDGDDWLDSISLNKVLEYLLSSDVDLLITNFVTNYADKKVNYINSYSLPENLVFDLEFLLKSLECNNQFLAMHSIIFKSDLLKNNGIIIQEKIFYVDLEYSCFPLKLVKSIKFINLNLYYYFIGRPEQSCNSDYIIKHYEHLCKVISKLEEVRKGLNCPELSRYYHRLMESQINNYINSLLFFDNDRKYVKNHFKEMNNLIKLNKIRINRLEYKFHKFFDFNFTKNILFNKIIHRLIPQ